MTTVDDARWMVARPDTDASALAAIAYAYPELRNAVSRHPNAYPALVEWIAAAGVLPQQVTDSSAVVGGMPQLQRGPRSAALGTTLASAAMLINIAGNMVFAGVLSSGTVDSSIAVLSSIMLITSIVSFLVGIAAVTTLPTTVGRHSVSAALVAIAGTLVVLNGVVPNSDGIIVEIAVPVLVVIAWLVARERNTWVFLLAPVVSASQFGAASLFSGQFWARFNVSPVVQIAVEQAIWVALLVGGCWLAAALSPRRRAL